LMNRDGFLLLWRLKGLHTQLQTSPLRDCDKLPC
jgi:hypothetical protein